MGCGLWPVPVDQRSIDFLKAKELLNRESSEVLQNDSWKKQDRSQANAAGLLEQARCSIVSTRCLSWDVHPRRSSKSPGISFLHSQLVSIAMGLAYGAL